MTALWLAARLARSGGRLRSVLVAGGCAVATLVLLVATAVPGTLTGPLTPDEQRLVAVALLVVALPVVTLVAAVARLSAAVRDRRLASLRILGVTAAATRTVAALETALMAAAGTLAGALAFLAVRPGLTAIDATARDWLAGGSLEPGPWGWAAGTLGVVTVAAIVASLPSRQVTRAPVGTRRQATVQRPVLWRLVPLTVGVALLVAASVVGSRDFGGRAAATLLLFFAGTAFTGLGLPLATPVAVRLLADGLIRWAPRPAVVLAARRLQQEPAGSARLVASLLTGVFVVTGALSVLAAFTATPQYLRAERAATTGPQAASVMVPPGAAIDPAALRSIPGVRALAQERSAALACTPEQARAYGEGPSGPPAACTLVVVASCAELPAWHIDVTGCVDGRPVWLRGTYPIPGFPDPTMPAPTVVAIDVSDDGTSSQITARLPLPPVTEQLSLRQQADDPNWAFNQDALLLPPSTPGLDAVLDAQESDGQERWTAVLDGGRPALDRFTEAALAQGLHPSAEDLQPYQQVQGYQVLLWTVAAVLIGVGLLALLLTGVDRAVERRRHLATLTTIGVPAGVLRRSQLLQTAAPLVFGLPAAGAAGLLAGHAYLSYTQATWATPWASVIWLTAAAIAGGLLIAAATVIGLGGRVRAAELRRE